MKRILTAMAVFVLALATTGTTTAAVPGPGTCAAPAAGGEWRRYGSDLANTRAQTAPTTINPGSVAATEKAWVFDASSLADTGILNGGTFSNTPVVADGCVYAASSTGWVFALNADTGARVWTSDALPGSSAGSLVGGVITGSPTVVDGRVYVALAEMNDPKVAALRQSDGTVEWIKPVLDPVKKDNRYRTNVVAAPVVFNGMVFQGIMADEAAVEPNRPRGGYAILDATTGGLIYQDWTITDAEMAAGYRGASIWCTAAADAATGYVYACGGNPASKQLEARYSNALLKIDMRCGAPTKTLAACRAENPTFGLIVDAYKGDVDQYYPGLDRQPACDQVPTTLVWSPTCVQLDLDFGASPSLFTVDVGGEPVQMLGDLQKSGVYHTVYADNMQRAWTAVVGAPGATWNAASGAVDGSQVYTAATPPAQLWALSKDLGRYRWVQPLGVGGTHFQSVSVANGVVFAINNVGELLAFEAATGLPIKRWPISLDTPRYAGALSSQGVAIARNTIYAASGPYVVAYN